MRWRQREAAAPNPTRALASTRRRPPLAKQSMRWLESGRTSAKQSMPWLHEQWATQYRNMRWFQLGASTPGEKKCAWASLRSGPSKERSVGLNKE